MVGRYGSGRVVVRMVEGRVEKHRQSTILFTGSGSGSALVRSQQAIRLLPPPPHAAGCTPIKQIPFPGLAPRRIQSTCSRSRVAQKIVAYPLLLLYGRFFSCPSRLLHPTLSSVSTGGFNGQSLLDQNNQYPIRRQRARI